MAVRILCNDAARNGLQRLFNCNFVEGLARALQPHTLLACDSCQAAARSCCFLFCMAVGFDLHPKPCGTGFVSPPPGNSLPDNLYIL